MCTIMKRQGPSLKYLEEVRPVLWWGLGSGERGGRFTA